MAGAYVRHAMIPHITRPPGMSSLHAICHGKERRSPACRVGYAEKCRTGYRHPSPNDAIGIAIPMRQHRRMSNNETANRRLPTSAHEYPPRIALPSSPIRSPAIPDCRSELTRETRPNYRLLPVGSTWTIGAIFRMGPGLVPGFTLGVADRAGECRGLGAVAHAQLGQEAVHVVLDCM
jgi:hypothetical protein